MGKSYSIDLHERISGYLAAGQSRRAAARVFGVSASTAVRLAAESRCRGVVTPKCQGRAPGTSGKLKAHSAFLVKIVRPKPDNTVAELAGALQETYGVSVLLSLIHRALIRARFSDKKALSHTKRSRFALRA
ncbi:hypothetical protein P775_26085 [Puniceibacterium antarcticum]|uniref:Transposase Synechocystis PCC 6803 domain-containing protein n=1 Tax=Puniceibacterium antarcticum TaxID=1206336 RepID=A0A2G8R059_9RHOB|nr:hypothetical protein [Puniceibacterium antarcticum]PIL14904.1 hypothetical protein P775_26085 [Puniceibacterium antarcticum]